MNRKITHLLLGLLTAALFSLVACSQKKQPDTQEAEAAKVAQVQESIAWNKVCPVCAGEVKADSETVTHAGKVYGFGCAGCPEKFAAEPEKYVNNLSADGTKFVAAD